jgi:hypothetical protein
MGVPEPTVRRWLRLWHCLGVRGVRVVPSAGRYGTRYLCARDLPARWRRGELPEPWRKPDPALTRTPSPAPLPSPAARGSYALSARHAGGS